MKWKDLRTSLKIMTGSGVILVLLAVVLAWATLGLGHTVAQAQEVGRGTQLRSDLLQREVDHLSWANQVATLLLDNSGKPFNVATDPTQCKFGKWFYSSARKNIETNYPDLTTPIGAMEAPHNALHGTAISMKSALEKNPGHQGRSEATAIFLSQTLPALQDVQAGLFSIREHSSKYILTEEGMLHSASKTRNGTLGIGAAAFILGLLAAWFIAHSITAPILMGVEHAKRIADGDFRNQMNLNRRDEVGQLANALDTMANNLRLSIVQIQESALAISTASGEISMGNTDLSRRTEEQAASLEETASSMEQIASNVNQTADNAKSANLESNKARQVAQDGGAAVTQVIAAMEAINQSSAKINEIIGVVDEIAFQTNLLALNAAVEAARAGEQGRGFAVVAAEVRNLAKRSADAAKEIKGLIRESVAKSVDGNKVAAHAGETIAEVVANVQRVTSLVSEIANATQEQSTGLNEVNKAVVSMDEVTQQNAALVEEAAAAAESLDSQAHALMDIVARFKTGVEAQCRSESRTQAGTARPPHRSPSMDRPVRAVAKRNPGLAELSFSKRQPEEERQKVP